MTTNERALKRTIDQLKEKHARTRKTLTQRNAWIKSAHNVLRLEGRALKTADKQNKRQGVRVALLLIGLSALSVTTIYGNDLSPARDLLFSSIYEAMN